MVSVIVLAYNNWPVSCRCLQSIAEVAGEADIEVIFFDNASGDETPHLARSFASTFPKFHYERSPVNRTCSAALNAAAAKASGTSLLFLNNDIELGAGALAALHAELRADPSNAIVGGRLAYPGGETLQHGGIVPMLWGHPINDGVGARRLDPRFARAGDAFAVTGAMFMVRATAFAAVGGFDEGFVWGLEDVDLCLRVQEAGWKVRYVPDAEAVHHESLTLGPATPRPPGNFERYRRRWGALLESRERRYIERLAGRGFRRFIIWGTGSAGRTVAATLESSGFDVFGFVDGRTAAGPVGASKPVWASLDDARNVSHDAVIVASQFFYTFEASVPRTALFPVV